MAPSSLPYQEPPITALLTLSTFTLALNAVNSILDRALYCGLVGQVLIGTAWGAPGARWLAPAVQAAVVQLGYLGLVLVVFEGGLGTRVESVRRNLGLAGAVAVTGVLGPVGASFLLALIADASPLQCFAAGAALCSTSLGTTFTVLATSGLARTRLGTVLSTAAMMDDVVGLVMVQIVESLGAGGGDGEGGGEIKASTVLRPVLVSLAFAVGVPVACRVVVGPVMRGWERRGKGNGKGESGGRWSGWMKGMQMQFVVQTAILLALVVAASYAGASVLLAAYLAGIMISWWDAQKDEPESSGATSVGRQEENRAEGSPGSGQESGGDGTHDASGSLPTRPQPDNQQATRHSGADVYDHYYSQAVNRVLKPFFFASIGFSIPISKVFSGEVVWRGIIYSILMTIGKMLCGLWLVRFPISISGLGKGFGCFIVSRYHTIMSRFRLRRASPTPKKNEAVELQHRREPLNDQVTDTSQRHHPEDPTPIQESHASPQPSSQDPPPPPAKPLSLYPSAILSFAMVARGEIGFLISAVAESNGIFRKPSDRDSDASELFLIVTWAIVVCTIIGPLSVGVLVERVKNLERKASSGDRGSKNVLGVWGVQ
ncbi:Sodium/hydrogen exchanger [Whalleya microplaca]|nr:Sodium/hydrogen exchanger [Whalleya microplaca]